MGDSEDEYDRKRRDKFRGERAETSYRGPERPVRPRDEWPERDAWARPRPREYGGRVRERGYSPSFEPAAKRMRNDYYGENYYNHYQHYHQPAHREPIPTNTEGQQPPMMSFKAFLATQDDNISDNEAIEKYNDYKLEFQRQQLNEFFVAHKDNEWFRIKYHPDDAVKRKEELKKWLDKRVEVFLELFKEGKFDEWSLDCGHDEELMRLLDTVVIKLEGGGEEDFRQLEEEFLELTKYRRQQTETKQDAPKEPVSVDLNKEPAKVEIKEAETQKSNGKEKPSLDGDVEKEEGEESDDKNDGEIPPSPVKMDVDPFKGEDEKKQPEISDENKNTENKEDANGKRKRSFSGSSSSGSSSSSGDEDGENVDKKEEKPADTGAKDDSEVVSTEDNDNARENKENVESINLAKEESGEDPKQHSNVVKTINLTKEEGADKPKQHTCIYKTTSIYLRNLAPTITKQEIEAMCSRYDGFIRLALAEPQPERRWLRRGWLTFKRDANIKEICWNLNNIRLRDNELGAIINRDLSKRIRLVNGITAHKQVVRSDIRIAAKVILHMDSKANLWVSEEDEEKRGEATFGLVSNNPVLHNITDYLIEEASAEEEELLGITEPSVDQQDNTTHVERDDELIKVLDRIVMYLRIVHSVDYYNQCEYPNEDEMPNKCGILHARGPPPTSKVDISQYVGPSIESKMAQFLPEAPPKEEQLKNENKLISMALKDVDSEIDKFVQANTRELAKDKWLCPLSGKKFKGPDFVRKHIFNKHAEKIDEVKKEVEFFNNYLRDFKRPMLPEAAPAKREEHAAPYSNPPFYRNYGGSFGGGGGGGGYGGYGPPARFNMYSQRSRGYNPRSRGGGGGGMGGSLDHRPVVHYRDLDAPREPDEFI